MIWPWFVCGPTSPAARPILPPVCSKRRPNKGSFASVVASKTLEPDPAAKTRPASRAVRHQAWCYKATSRAAGADRCRYAAHIPDNQRSLVCAQIGGQSIHLLREPAALALHLRRGRADRANHDAASGRITHRTTRNCVPSSLISLPQRQRHKPAAASCQPLALGVRSQKSDSSLRACFDDRVGVSRDFLRSGRSRATRHGSNHRRGRRDLQIRSPAARLSP